MKHFCRAKIRELDSFCEAPARKIYGFVWLCDSHYLEANWRGDDGFRFGFACEAYTTTDSGAPPWSRQFHHLP